MEAICRDEDSDSEILDELVEYPDVEYTTRENFSKSAITKLSDRLMGDEERNTKKLVYLGVFTRLNRLARKESWLEVDASDDTGRFPLSCIDYYMLQDMPPELKELTHYGRAVWRSKIVVVGGRPRIRKHPLPKETDASDKVFMYDLVSKKWETQQMKVKRGSVPTVVVAGDNLFVFGGHPKGIRQDKNYLQALARQWSEFFDPDTKSWTCFPDPTPLDVAEMNHICDHVVCPNQHLILFWMLDWSIVYFNYKDWKWGSHGDNTPISRPPEWSAKAVVLEDFLFWNDRTTIYAYDLCGRITLPVCTLPLSESWNSFLVHIGKGMLCLFREDHDRIRYITFLVKINWSVQAPTIHLVADRTGFLNTPNPTLCIALALGISSGEEGSK